MMVDYTRETLSEKRDGTTGGSEGGREGGRERERDGEGFLAFYAPAGKAPDGGVPRPDRCISF